MGRKRAVPEAFFCLKEVSTSILGGRMYFPRLLKRCKLRGAWRSEGNDVVVVVVVWSGGDGGMEMVAMT